MIIDYLVVCKINNLAIFNVVYVHHKDEVVDGRYFIIGCSGENNTTLDSFKLLNEFKMDTNKDGYTVTPVNITINLIKK